MGRLDDAERVHAETVQQWRSWLLANHSRATGAWLVSWKKHTGRPALDYEEVVIEALTVGWVDSTARRLDNDRTMLYLAPRKPRSGWSAPNKRRIELLERTGRMTDAGRQVVDAARADGSWWLLDDVEKLVVPDDLAVALAAHPPAAETFAAFPRSARRALLQWIVQARRPQTRERRVLATAEAAQRGERANEWSAGGRQERTT